MQGEVKWIKITTSMFDDDKMKLIEMMPEKDTVLIIWIKLLIQAGKTNSSGYIFLSEKIPYTEEMLATIFNRPLNSIRLALSILSDFGMIERLNGGVISIVNWEKHQNKKGLDDIREQRRLRQAKYRENKKLIEHKTKEDIDIDIEGNATNNVTISDMEKMFNEFWKRWPRKEKKKESRTKYHKIIKSKEATHDRIMTGLDLYLTCEKVQKGFVQMPTTWLNGAGWDDEYEQPQQKPKDPNAKVYVEHYGWLTEAEIAAIDKEQEEVERKLLEQGEIDENGNIINSEW